jgi:hypothetical protein
MESPHPIVVHLLLLLCVEKDQKEQKILLGSLFFRKLMRNFVEEFFFPSVLSSSANILANKNHHNPSCESEDSRVIETGNR